MASLDDILTTAKNLVTAINNASQTYLSINGLQTISNITSATVIKTTTGRVGVISIVVAGSANGTIYDTTTASSTANPIYKIPDTLGAFFVNMPVSNGIVVAPGTGQTVSISYS